MNEELIERRINKLKQHPLSKKDLGRIIKAWTHHSQENTTTNRDVLDIAALATIKHIVENRPLHYRYTPCKNTEITVTTNGEHYKLNYHHYHKNQAYGGTIDINRKIYEVFKELSENQKGCLEQQVKNKLHEQTTEKLHNYLKQNSG